MNDKEQLLDEVEAVLNIEKPLDWKYLVFTMLIMSFFLLVLFPKIYIQQQIFYKSRDISKLQGEYDTLVEENILINTSVESIRFKNQILDTLF